MSCPRLASGHHCHGSIAAQAIQETTSAIVLSSPVPHAFLFKEIGQFHLSVSSSLALLSPPISTNCTTTRCRNSDSYLRRRHSSLWSWCFPLIKRMPMSLARSQRRDGWRFKESAGSSSRPSLDAAFSQPFRLHLWTSQDSKQCYASCQYRCTIRFDSCDGHGAACFATSTSKLPSSE